MRQGAQKKKQTARRIVLSSACGTLNTVQTFVYFSKGSRGSRGGREQRPVENTRLWT